jgi:hypothetical protein
MSTGLTSGRCPACGAAISGGDRACPACGLDLIADELAKIAYTTRFLEWARRYWLLDEQAHARLQRELDKAHRALMGAAWQPHPPPRGAQRPPAPLGRPNRPLASNRPSPLHRQRRPRPSLWRSGPRRTPGLRA